jgi:hypothetical protein
MELRGVVDQVAWPVVMAGLPAERRLLAHFRDTGAWLPRLRAFVSELTEEPAR